MKTTDQIAAEIVARLELYGAEREKAKGFIAAAIFSDRCEWQDRIAAACAERDARIADLLDTNNRYLEEARQARRERDALLRGFKGIAAAIAVAVKDEAQ